MFSKSIVTSLFVIFVLKNFQIESSPIRPYRNYTYSTELEEGLANLWWSIDEVNKEITFEFHLKTTGWIALGISPAGGMTGADIGLGWIDDDGKIHFEDRFATGERQPMIDNTTIDWFATNGREENGWTAIQFKRFLDTCDSMDVPIKSGTNILIYAYSTDDPTIIDGKASINYHGDRKFTKAIPLQSYGNPPAESKFNGLDSFDFQLNNYKIPTNSTTYHCRIYRAPTNYPSRRHSIGYKMLIDQRNRDIVHHLLMYECNPGTIFNDENLPEGICDEIYQVIAPCASNIATGWAVGGDTIVEFPEAAGYPVGGDFEIKYYMVQMHYNNPHLFSNRSDSSGVRFYLAENLRQFDIGYLTLGTDSGPFAIAIPPRANQFIIDSYCPAEATSKIPENGITVVASFPHTHLQGQSLWTKIIRNQTAVDYLFNAESYNFNYQFQNVFPKPIKLFPGDEFSTRCIYKTLNKDKITLGGEATTDEMCLHMFIYYPRINDFYGCLNSNHLDAWRVKMNITEDFDYDQFKQSLLDLTWNNQTINDWQKFYDTASRAVFFGHAGDMTFIKLDQLPNYKDLDPTPCKKHDSNNATHFNIFSFFTLFLLQLICFFSI